MIDKKGVSMVLVMVIWASFYTIIKVVVTAVDPLTLSFQRYLLGILPLTPFFLRELSRTPDRPSPGDMVRMTLLGLLGVTSFAVCLFFGLDLSTAVNGALLTNTQPLFAALLGTLILGESLSLRRASGAAVGLIGMALVVTGGDFSLMSDESDAPFLGNLLLLGASLSLTLYSVLMKRYVRRYGGLIPTWLSMTSGTIALFLINTLRGEANFVLRTLSPGHLALVLYLGIVGTSLTYLVFNRALANMPVVVASSYKMLIPVFGLVFAVVFIAERPNGWTLTGVAVVLASLWIIQRVPVDR